MKAKPIKAPAAGPSAAGALPIQLGYNAEDGQVVLRSPSGDYFFTAAQAHALGSALIQHAEAASGRTAS